MLRAVKRSLALLLAVCAACAWAQEGRSRAGGPGPRGHFGVQRAMPPGAGMSWEERQRLREELKDGRRDAWRQGVRAPQGEAKRAAPPPMPPEERERLRQDIRDANRDLAGKR